MYFQNTFLKYFAHHCLRILDPIQSHALRLCLGAFRTSPSSSLCVLANEPPLYIRRQKLAMQYCLRLSSASQNPAHSAVFNYKFKSSFDRKPNQIPPLGIRIQPELQAIGFSRKVSRVAALDWFVLDFYFILGPNLSMF